MKKVILLRHGESQWNQQSRFTRWENVPLTQKGVEEAQRATNLIKRSRVIIDGACTFVLNRAVHSFWPIVETLNQLWLPIDKSWRLNERHYGALQGMNKDKAAQQIGQNIVYHWRRNYRGIPPPLLDAPILLHRKTHYHHVSLADLPTDKSLEMTQRRLLPYWHHVIVPRVANGGTMLLVGHANTLRMLTIFIEQIDGSKVPDLHVLTGIPVLYEMNENRAIAARYSLEWRSGGALISARWCV